MLTTLQHSHDLAASRYVLVFSVLLCIPALPYYATYRLFPRPALAYQFKFTLYRRRIMLRPLTPPLLALIQSATAPHPATTQSLSELFWSKIWYRHIATVQSSF
ncbi:hypothetical protein EW026_g178 [Hermanssonia centrifuga]|uniref:Uncharacterized protein n=1 Tax=Hermanssonia centrifuga TaxID=98765 RepID=A0A4S4KVH6_9APHY|nr:hypothetical protein EW026_g178 [Hermanssonia centrifuga]